MLVLWKAEHDNRAERAAEGERHSHWQDTTVEHESSPESGCDEMFEEVASRRLVILIKERNACRNKGIWPSSIFGSEITQFYRRWFWCFPGKRKSLLSLLNGKSFPTTTVCYQCYLLTPFPERSVEFLSMQKPMVVQLRLFSSGQIDKEKLLDIFSLRLFKF